MEFIDKTGHIFSLNSYSEYPTGYEYEENPYVFWINETGKLSINNYYIKPIRIVLSDNYSFTDNTKLSIKLESSTFGLLGSVELNKLLRRQHNLFEYFNISEKNIKQELTEDDVIVLNNLTDDNNNLYSMITFYIVCYSTSASVMLTNILIDVSENSVHDYCPITVGAEFVDENEMLIINGKNMGISLPKDILRAIYKSSFYNYANDEYLYNSKLKELLLNIMDIKGECGNYKSAINALKWFGWGDKLKLVKLIETDNQFINQYILDSFDITNDFIESYNLFRNTSFIKLFIEGTEETDEINKQNFDIDFWGEGKPIVKDLINSNNYYTYDENDLKFYKPYYDFLFDELGLKLAALEYYYKKYFLPIHIFIHSCTIEFQCFTNDNKIITAPNKTILTEIPQLTYDIKNNITVEFPNENYVMLTTQTHYLDDNYNEFNKYIVNANEDNNSLYYWVYENCMSIPIKFNQYDSNGEEKEEQYYDCNIILEKLEKSTYNYIYSFNFYFDYNEFFTLNISDENGNATNNVLISHKLWKVNYNNQKLIMTDEWSDYMSYSDTKKYILENYINKVPFLAEKPTFNIKIKTINYLSQIKANNFNYIKYANCEIIDDEHKIIFERNFKFVQNKNDKTSYYKNFVIVPKLFGKLYDINFWLNNEFNIYLSVNNKWYNYNFNCKVPELQLEIGKLKYKYFLNTTINDVNNSYFGQQPFIDQHGDVSLFNQINGLTDNSVSFNRFIWQPNLVKVNNIDFFDNLLEYYKNYKYNITYNKEDKNINVISCIEGNTNMDDIQLNDLYYVITLNNQKFYIHNDVIREYFLHNNGQYIKLNLNQLTNENASLDWAIYYDDSNKLNFISVYNESNYPDYYNLNENEYRGSSGSLNKDEFDNVLITNEDGTTLKFNTVNYNKLETNILDTSNNDNFIIVFEDEEIVDKKYLYIFFELDNNNCIHFYIKDIYNNNYYLLIEKTIYKNINILLDKYKDLYNIVNNKKYLNKIHLFDLYKNNQLFLYDKNISQKELAEIYNIFFNQNYPQYSPKINIDDIYDLYLMHDNYQWYVLFISKYTENNYYNTELDIITDNKLLELNNIIGKAYSIKEINLQILKHVCLEYGLSLDDLFIVFNDIELSDSEVDASDDMFDTLIENKLINKIFNKNIGASITSNIDDSDIIWNDYNNVNAVSQNWIKIHPNDIYCPICGSNEHIELIYNSDTNTYNIVCHNHFILDDNGIQHNYTETIYTNVNLDNSSVFIWNSSEIKYKLIYSLSDDIWSEDNPDGNYHLPTYDRLAQYTFSMNNKLYYITGQLQSDNTIKYYLFNNEVSIYSKQDGYDINDLSYDEDRDTYVAENVLSSDGELHNFDYINGLDKNISYSIDLNNIIIYTDSVNSYQEEYINNYYILYDGTTIYNNEWYMIITVNPYEIDGPVEMSDIIKIYKKSDDTELQWIVNPNYNYDAYDYETKTGKYIYNRIITVDDTNIYNNVFIEVSKDIITENSIAYYKLYDDTVNKDIYIPIYYSDLWYENIEYYIIKNGNYILYTGDIIDTDNLDLYIKYNNNYYKTEYLNENTTLYVPSDSIIKFKDNVPEINIYMDDKGYFFELVFIDGRWTKRLINRTLSNEIETISNYSLYDVNTGTYYKEDNKNVIFNVKSWWDEHDTDNFILKDPIDDTEVNHDKPQFDGLWYLYYETEEYYNNTVIKRPNWQVLVYIANNLTEKSLNWYYKINGIKYEYTGPVVSYAEINGEKIQLDINATDSVFIDLNSVGLSPIKVDVTKIDETSKHDAYYNIIDNYKLKYVKSDDKFLINRMDYISSNGLNHFNSDDIIVCTVSPKMDKNNVEYKTEFKLNFGTKWIFEPMSLKMKNGTTVNSTSEMGIVSIGDSNIKYDKGYYTVKCNYSLDTNTQNIYTKTARILIE